MSDQPNAHRASVSGMLLFIAIFSASILACLWVVAVKKAAEGAPSTFVMQTLASFGYPGLAFLLVVATVLGIASARPQVLPWLVAVSSAGFVLLRLALHVLHPELDPVRTPMSLYAQTSHGYLMLPSFLLSSGLILAGGLYLTGGSPRPVLRRITIAVLGVLVGASVVVGVFPADEGQNMSSDIETLSMSGSLHKVAGSGAFPLTLALPFLILPQIWRRLANRAARVWLVSVAVAFPFMLGCGVAFSDYIGIVQRVFLLGYIAWLTLACLAVQRIRTRFA